MRFIGYCQWLDWAVDINCSYEPMIPFLLYYYQLFTMVDKTLISKVGLYTNIEIYEEKKYVEIRCGNRHKKISADCNFIMGIVAEFCNDDFMEKKKRNWCLLHGAAISSDGKYAQLFLASTGKGKSTLAYYASTHNFWFCSDDLIILDMDTGYLLPYPKPIYLRSTAFLTESVEREQTFWYRYRLLFTENEVKYPVFPIKCICEPIQPVAVHIYDRGDFFKCIKLTMTEGFQELLFSSINIDDMRQHNNYLVQLIHKFKIDHIWCSDLDKLICGLGNTLSGNVGL